MRRPSPGSLLFAAVIITIGVLVGLGVGSILGLRSDFETADNARTELANDVIELRAQLLALGEVPDAPPPKPGERGEQGAPGSAGQDGEDGKDGRDGRDGEDGEDGESPPCLLLPTRCVGAQGPAGPAGADGADGQDGANGATGPAGPQGPQGPPGPSGQTCPDGYTLQPALVQGDEVLVCTRAG